MKGGIGLDEPELITRCKLGDGDSFALLVKPYVSAAYRAAYLIVNDSHLAHDAVQEGLIEAYRSIKRFDEKRGLSFRAWFTRMVIYRSLNLVRKRKAVDEYLEVADERWTPLASILAKEERERVWKAICSLDVKFRTVIVLHYYEGFSVAEIARIIGVFEGTVKSRLYKARKLIAAALGQNSLSHSAELGVMAND